MAFVDWFPMRADKEDKERANRITAFQNKEEFAKNIKQMALQKLIYRKGLLIDSNLLANIDQIQVDAQFDCLLDKLMVTITAILIGETVSSIRAEYPANWKEAVKDRFLPGWLRKYWPVRYKELVMHANVVYPLISLPEEKYSIYLSKHLFDKNDTQEDYWGK